MMNDRLPKGRFMLGVLILTGACTGGHEGKRDTADSSDVNDTGVGDTADSGDTGLRSCSGGAAAFFDDGAYFETVQAALDVVADGATVHVCPGTHEGALSLLFSDSSSNPLFAAGGAVSIVGDADGSSVIDANGEGSVVETEIVSLTLASLSLVGGAGRGFSAGDGADWTYIGGGIYDLYADLSLDDVRIEGNTANYGGGIAVDGTFEEVSLAMSNCTIDGNVALPPPLDAPANGGGVWLSGSYSLNAVDTDWGEGTEDNSPQDIVTYDGAAYQYYLVPEGSSVTCVSGTECTFG